MSMLSAGAIAPDFQLAATSGEKFSLSPALSRGPVLLAFFKVSCPTCQYTFPFLERLHEQLQSRGIQVAGIVQDKAPEGRRFASTLGIKFPILVDEAPYRVSRAYGLLHVPSLFLIKADGRIALSGDGFCKADLLAIHKSLAKTLGATPPALFLANEKIPDFKPG